MNPGTHIECKTLRRINSEMHRQAALEYLESKGGIVPGTGPGVRRKREKREFVDWYNAESLEIVRMDVNSRFKLIASVRERTWTNGLCFYLWVISWLSSPLFDISP